MIRIWNLSKHYGSFHALEDVSLQVEPGEIFGFLGPNGAGKTTTIRVMAGLLRPTSGTVEIAGHDILKEPEAAKAAMGLVPDRPFLYEKLTGDEFLLFLGGIYGLSAALTRQRMEQLLSIFELEQWRGQLIENYSHGMKQRLVMCAALLHRPLVLVVDEPMVGLDPRGSRLLKEVFRKEAKQRGASIFMSTHSLEVAEEMCDRIAILQKGRIIAQGTPEELRKMAGESGEDLESVFLRLTGGEDLGGLEGGLPSR
ncbi:MAG: ABC transporter ATP-binding protein [bacterium]